MDDAIRADSPLPAPSTAQRRLWFVCQFEGQRSTYNVPVALRLKGALRIDALERALAHMVERHEALRYCFPAHDGEPVIAFVQASFALERRSLAADRADALDRLEREEAVRPFDLEHGPLFRPTLVALGPDDHVLLLNIHHIVIDDWSVGILLKDLGSAYDAFREDRPSPLVPLRFQFSDHLRRQAVESSPFIEEQTVYWRRRMADAPSLLPLPTDRPRPKRQRFVGDRRSFHLPLPVADGLRKLSRSLGATLFMTTLAGFAILLGRYASQSDLVIGAPVARRTTPEAEGLIGFFVNVLPFRLDLTGEPDFAALVTRVRTVVLDGFDNADVPFDRLVEMLRPARSLGHTPLFQVMFDLLTDSFGSLTMAGLEVGYRPLNSGTAKYDLTATLKETGEGLIGAFEYSTDLFESETIERMIDHFVTLLTAAAAAPETPIAALPMRSAAETRYLLELAAPAQRIEAASFVPFHALFEAAVARRPEADAIVYRDRRLGYGALDARASVLAGRLRRHGAATGTLVAVFLDYGPDVVLALLAIHKAGAAFLPIAPDDARWRDMVADARPALILTSDAFADRLSGQAAPILRLDAADDDGLAAEPGRATEAGDLAYLIYTSGSTGRPKGVEILHGGLASAYQAWSMVYDLATADLATLQMANCGFDVFIGDVVRTLASGGRLVMCPRESLLEPADLHRLIAEESIRFAEFVPVVLRQSIDHLEAIGARLPTLRTLVCGSDVWFVHEYRRARALCGPQARVFGSYGVTEATIDSALFELDGDGIEADRIMPIGRPLPNTRLYIVDPTLDLVPQGVAGELVIGGPAVAAGYRNRPTLTAARFLTGAVTPEGRLVAGAGTERFYRTGDLCRHAADGTVAFLGRLDHQVKIRGFRIEPGEIESVLSDHPDVLECVVLARPSAAGEHELVGYLRATVPAQVIRDYLRQRLPSHMVPSILMPLDRFPLTASGKIDRKALPAPDVSAAGDAIPPRTETERRIAKVWADVLRHDRVGIHDNFFGQGGHSLLAARLVARLRDLFRIPLPISAVFDAPTVAELARTIEATHRDTLVEAPIPRADMNERQRLSFAQRRLWLTDRIERAQTAYNVPDAVHLTGRLRVRALERAINDVVGRHDSLRTVFSPTVETIALAEGGQGDEPVQRVLPTLAVTLRVMETTGDVPVQHLLAQEAASPFDLGVGPLIRAVLLVLGAEEHVLCVTTHHIVSDGWSSGLFWRELAACYRGRIDGEVPALPPLRVQYADYAAWQRARLADGTYAGQLDYWSRQLAAPPPPIALPTRRGDPTGSLSAAGATLHFAVPPPVAAGLRGLAQRLRCTPFMLLHAAFAILLYRYSGQQDLIVGSPIAGRRHPDVEPLIGFFVNMLPLRLTLQGHETVEAIVRRARQTCLDAFEHQDIPFDHLVERLNPERQAGRHPLFQIGFVWQVDTAPALALPDLAITPVAIELGQAKLDLVLALGGESGAFEGGISYRTALFDPPTIGRMRDHLLRLLDAIVANPTRPIAALPFLTEPERHQLLHTWNDTAAPLPEAPTLHGLFETRARVCPNGIALELGARRWTYRALDRTADRIADALLARGLGSGHHIGIFTGRHPDMVAAMLGILKAGAAYVPLDPDDPNGRWTAHVLEDARIAAVIARPNLLAAASRLERPVILVEDGDAPAPIRREKSPVVSPTDRAYVIYTSGSTGRPKGVAVRHLGICNTTLAFVRRMGLDPDARQLQFFSPIFDGVGCEVFPTLAAGGTLVFGSREDLLPGPGLGDFIARARISHLLITPSALRLVPTSDLPELRAVMSAGEPCPIALAQQWAIGRRFLNGYGPTEASVCASATEYWQERGRLVLRPIDNAELHVLDADGNLLPIGAAGELCIGGAGLAEGYLGLPEHTAAAFIVHPYDLRPGARLYRTGDRARRLADGSLEFLGRTDRQVKIRGFRIELDEVAAVLGGLPGVIQAAVLAEPDRRGQMQLVAYLAGSIGRDAALAAARAELPSAMVPGRFVLLAALPRTEAGKIDHRALRVIEDESVPVAAEPPADRWEAAVMAVWREVLERSDIGLADNFFDLGGHSLRLAVLHQRLTERLGAVLSMTDLFQYPTVRSLARFLSGPAASPPPVSNAGIGDGAIAIIGLAGRFPGAQDLDSFWENLRRGVDATQVFSDEELLARGVDPAMLGHPAFVRNVLPLEDADRFDAGFFGFSPKEAQVTDPQHRIFLECAWAAMESGGYGDRGAGRPVGVFAACGISHYLLDHVHPRRHELHIGPEQWVLGNDKDFLATRTAYKLDLRGPAITVETACSSSLAAVHLACVSLRRGECEMALAGGISIDAERYGYLAAEGGILSATGRCRPFDAAADGTTSGSGGAVILLKPLAAALADRDTIHAVIKGSAINNDGMDKVSYTAPSVEGQTRVITRALEAAGVPAETISYVEAHGTGTRLGDPIEVRALNRAFGTAASNPASCALGSVKSNIGHLDTAAGIAGLVKTVLALRHREIPPSPHFNHPNPEIDFAGGPFFVNTECRPWPETEHPRRAGVSAFGVGGTNVHVILEEPPPSATMASPLVDEGPHILVLSARTPQALRSQARRLSAHLNRHPDQLADAAFTLQVGRTRFSHRAALVCRSALEAVAQLTTAAGRAVAAPSPDRPVIFMFPGQGSQHVDMARGLYDHEPVFRAAFDRCAERLRGLIGRDIRAIVHPAPAERAMATELLGQTRYAQPALFAVEYALAQLLMQAGLRPRAMIGHSLGEYVAACLSGLFGLEDALALVARRGALMQAQPPGAMLAIEGPETEIRPYLGPDVELAAINGPTQHVLAGGIEAIAAVERACLASNRPHRRLRTSHAFHSALMDDAAAGLRAGAMPPAGRIAIPFVSNHSGTWFAAADGADPDYWAEHLRRPVRFAAGIATLLSAGDDPILLEVGPGRALRTLLAAPGGPTATVLSCLPHARETASDRAAFAAGLAGLWQQGAAVDWACRVSGAPGRVPLPTYPFQRDRHWIDAPRTPAPVAMAPIAPTEPALLRSWRQDGPGRTIFTLAIPPDHWLVDEHRIFDGRPTLPGSACLELVRGAFMRWHGADRIELRDVYFPAPLVLAEAEERQVRILFAQRADETEFTLQSRTDGGEWQPHAQGIVAPHRRVPAPDALRHVLDPRDMPIPAGDLAALDAALVAYGPRWHCFAEVRCLADHGLARLHLDPRFAGDCRDFALHPALLDVATAFLSLQSALGKDQARTLVPFHYRRLTLFAPLRPQIFSHARRVGSNAYDVTLFAARSDQAPGFEILAEIEHYLLRELATVDARPLEAWCQVPEWLPAPGAGGDPDSRPWLIFADGLDGAPSGSITVVRGERYERLGPTAYRLRPEDHAALLAELDAAGRLPDHLVYGWTLAPQPGDTHPAIEAFESFMALVRPLGTAARRPMLISLLTRSLAGLRGETAQPHGATAVGLMRAISWEFPHIRCRQIDLGPDEPAAMAVAELRHRPTEPPSAAGGTIALRAGRRFAQGFRTLPADDAKPPLRAGGVYLITGGLGGIGLALARHIAQAVTGAKLVLLARTDEPSADRRAALNEIEALGADVVLLAADVADPAAMTRVVAETHSRFGPVTGAIHAAGVEASGLIETARAEGWRPVLAPKILGTDRLIEAIRGDAPDFILLCSSLAGLVGGLGQADYAAANAYLDAAASGWRAEGLPVTALGWDAWAEVGMRVAHDRRMGRPIRDGRAMGLSTLEGCALFDLVLRSRAPRVLVSKAASVAALLQAQETPSPVISAVAATKSVPPATPVELAIASLWEELLGIERPGIEDSFFDYGGHSLLATQLISRLRDRFGRCLTLGDFLEEPTIARIARSIPPASPDGLPDEDADVRFCLVPVEAKGAGTPYFCLPGMGGNVSQMLALAAALGGERPFFGLQCLGLDGLREPHRSVEEMAEHYIRCVKSVQPKGPYLLGGHSLGGKVAYEMAHRLHLAGDRVAHLALFDSAAPPYMKLPEPDDAQVLYTLLGIFGYYFNKTITLSEAEHQVIAILDLDAKLTLLRQRLEAFDLVRPGSDAGTIRGLFKVYQAAGRFGMKYDPSHAPIPVPITLFKAVHPMPPTITLPEIRETEGWGWERFTTLPIEIHEVPGDHFSCLTPPHVQAIADRLRRGLAKADG